MAYVTFADMIRRFGTTELEQRAPGAELGVIDVERVQGAIGEAVAEIDGYVGTRYPLPLTPVPALLGRLAGDIARYRLYDDASSEEVRKRYEDAVRLLRGIADGQVSLGERPGTPTTPHLAQVVQQPGNALFKRRPGGGLR
ncbi:gp436 family protein [Pseudothauera rhizosphaerae]|uniref:DUF1320 domain-containing protein n=1 Tax=Pseudothauera rhizosphaerae TaxID=2565932 RepID=A0A4S4AMZ1_9RHOO|nr:DUF1320 domain-containing protein [Pseudothauera rhizosphaerae]THF60908.1 DUF1320 domain-containing protein [Pseudothauera rhizosphaerae]